MMETARTSETSVDNYFTRQYIPEDNSKESKSCFRFPIFILSDWLVTSALKMETVYFSETLASTYETTRGQNPRQHQYYTNRRENVSFNSVEFTQLPDVLGAAWGPQRSERPRFENLWSTVFTPQEP
jgi:hypothetical protein